MVGAQTVARETLQEQRGEIPFSEIQPHLLPYSLWPVVEVVTLGVVGVAVPTFLIRLAHLAIPLVATARLLMGTPTAGAAGARHLEEAGRQAWELARARPKTPLAMALGVVVVVGVLLLEGTALPVSS